MPKAIAEMMVEGQIEPRTLQSQSVNLFIMQLKKSLKNISFSLVTLWTKYFRLIDDKISPTFLPIHNIIIIMSCRQHGYPWPSLATSPYHLSPPAGLQGYILCPHIVDVCMFVLVVLLLHIHMWGSTGVHRLWARPCFSSSAPRVWFVWLV